MASSPRLSDVSEEFARLPCVVVLVLGDVGRSPRMQYHALSLAQTRAVRVFLVGYAGERCVPAVEAEEMRGAITQVRLTADLLPRPKARALYLVYAPLKAALQLLQLMWTLLVRLPAPAVLLLQNPPAIPTLAAAWLARLLRGGAVVVDWHNLAYSVLEHGLRPNHPFVRVARAYERALGRRLDGHLCVTHAMQSWLRTTWGVPAHVLHDRPPSFFQRLELPQKHELLRRLAPQLVDASGAPLWAPEGTPGSPWADGATPWSLAPETARAHAPRLLISSTSWTADEDFGLLLEALRALDTALIAFDAAFDADEARQRRPARSGGVGGSSPGRRAASPKKGGAGGGAGGGGGRGGGDGALADPQVVAIITGKGPLKEYYRSRMRELTLRRVALCTLWLEPEDYPKLLGSADLGVCLHTSTSGLDLPMKVLDMYGCGLPVCALGFACLRELVRDGANGRVFHTSEELAQQLLALLAPTPEAALALSRLTEGVAKTEAGRPRWAQNWDTAAAPLLVPSPAAARAARSWLGRSLLLLLLAAPLIALLAAMAERWAV